MVIGPFCFEKPAVFGDTFLATMENTALYHIPVGTVFHLDGAQFFCPVYAFLDRTHFLASNFLDLTAPDFLFWVL
jgi:hypothetical protein